MSNRFFHTMYRNHYLVALARQKSREQEELRANATVKEKRDVKSMSTRQVIESFSTDELLDAIEDGEL